MPIMKNYFLLLFSFILFASCNNDNDPNENLENDCTTTACTYEFRSILVNIKDSDGNIVKLDKSEVIDSDSKETILDETYNDQTSTEFYLLYSDSFQSEIINEEREIIFKGYIDNNEVISSNYVVSSDCCHIFLVEGNLDLIIN